MHARALALTLILAACVAAPLMAQQPASSPDGQGTWKDSRVVPATHTEPMALPPAGQEKVVPLSPPGKSLGRDGQKSNPLSSLITIVGSLAVVLGLFLFASWCVKRSLPKASLKLPGGVIEVLGQARLVGRHQVHLVRCGNKLLLLSVTPSGADTLTEITDPVEVDRLAGLCRQAQATSATTSFRKMLDSFASGKAAEEDSDA